MGGVAGPNQLSMSRGVRVEGECQFQWTIAGRQAGRVAHLPARQPARCGDRRFGVLGFTCTSKLQPVPRAQSRLTSSKVQSRPPTSLHCTLACDQVMSPWQFQPLSDSVHGQSPFRWSQPLIAVSLQHRTAFWVVGSTQGSDVPHLPARPHAWK